MNEQKDGVLVVPAEIRFNESGVVSFFFNFTTNDGSLLRKLIETKTIDDSKSVVGSFVREVANAETKWLPKSWIVLSGQFQFVDESELESSSEAINQRVMQLLAERYIAGDDTPCEHCTRKNECCNESSIQGESWQEPTHDVCAKHVIEYFLSKAKNASSN